MNVRPVTRASRRPAWPLAAFLLALCALMLPVGPAAAADDASVDYVEASRDGLRVLVTVPPTAAVDLEGVRASLDGGTLEASARLAGTDTTVERTAVLAIDTSESMAKQGRFDAAKAAAAAFLEAVPRDVEVGVVTFDGEVTTALEPTTDRSAAQTVIAGLELARGTLLYDGVLAAAELAGSEGQRSLLVLSDGADTGGAASLDDVTASLAETGTLVDVVSLDQRGAALAALRDLSEAGNGQVVEASGEALADAFAAEAELLASQVLVTAPLPDGFDATQATVEVTLPTGSGELVASAFARIQDASGASEPVATTPEPAATGWEAPEWLLYAGAVAFGIGVLLVVMLLVPAGPAPASISDRLGAYTRHTGVGAGRSTAEDAEAEPVLDQAKAAAAGMLARNRGLERRLSVRLVAAGSPFKPSEWLLLHLGVMFGATLLGLLMGGVLFGLLFLVLGSWAPLLYLRFRAGRRRRAFNAHLPETLSLMAGALSAGLSLAQSVDTVVREGPEPIASEFKRVLIETRIGVALEDAFDAVAERFASKDFAWVVMAIRIQRQVGGNLAELLTTVAGTMREREYLRRQVQTLAAEGKLSAYVLVGLPPLFTVFVLLTQPGYFDPMLQTLIGMIVLAGGVLWLAVGAFWMSRLVKVEV